MKKTMTKKRFTLIKKLDYHAIMKFLDAVDAPEIVSRIIEMNGIDVLDIWFERTDYHQQIVDRIAKTMRIDEYDRIEFLPCGTSNFADEKGIMLVIIVSSEHYNPNYLKLKNRNLYNFIEAFGRWR